MQKDTMLVALGMLLVGGLIGYAVAGVFGSQTPYERGGMVMHDEDFMADSDTHSMADMMNMMVSSEREFLVGMIPHHQEAVDTANELLARGGTTPEIRALAAHIITAQEAEIASMKTWYQDWYGEAYQDDGTYHEMMRELESLSDVALDHAFLEDMIMHHMGAIMMARSVQPFIKHEEVATLTNAIVTTQSAEIVQMREMLVGLNQ